MHWARVVVVALAVVEGGWMAFDGCRALVVGDFITPTSGAHAGQLGPWRHVVERVGLRPRSTGVKAFFAVYGLAWLAVTVGFLLGARWGWSAMVTFAVGSLWYLPVGTMLSVIQLVLLLSYRVPLR